MEQMYPEAERRIFQFFNGVKQICGDPLQIYRRLNRACGGDVNRVLNDSRAGIDQEGNEDLENEPVRFEATERLLTAVRASFPMHPYNPDTGEGATDDECLTALQSFIKWTQKKSQNGAMPSP